MKTLYLWKKNYLKNKFCFFKKNSFYLMPLVYVCVCGRDIQPERKVGQNRIWQKHKLFIYIIYLNTRFLFLVEG